MLSALKAVGRVDGPALHDSASSENGGYREPRPRKLYRLREGHWIAGVCTGLAAYARIDPVLIRLIFILAGVFSGGVAILVYVILAFVMPIALTDDDSVQVNVPFAFSFYGRSQTAAFVNSDGNVTFERGDNASTERNVARLLTGQLRR